ncbi:MAG: NAD-dependent epimerase/dehydratase family protein [Chloroflexi bacterium]|nr:NAD-dependent epimerase/dehydratase family protein [Chloroflexota bacterium]
MTKTILVTGVSDYWGGRVAARLVQEPDVRVVGISPTPPPLKIEGVDFIQVDVRNPLLVELLTAEQVDTICHLEFDERSRPSEAAFDLNVMGTMRLFGAAAQAGVRHLVWRSSTAVYGAQASNPAFLPESWPLNGNKQHGGVRYAIEIEEFAAGFAQQNPEMGVTILRLANVMGPTVNSPLGRYIAPKFVPVLLGFNPVLQLLHEDDGVEALVHACLNAPAGVFNIGAADVLPLAKIIRLAQGQDVPVLHPLVYWAGGRFGRLLSFGADYLRYRWVGDTAKLAAEFGWQPTRTAEEAVREFTAAKRTSNTSQHARALDEEYLREVLAKRGQVSSEK